jgi:hypothetical protein
MEYIMKLNQLEEQMIFRVSVRALSNKEVLALADIKPYMRENTNNGDTLYKRDQLLETTNGQLNDLYSTMKYVEVDYLLVHNKKR